MKLISVEDEVLWEGDKVTVGVTHEFQVGGEKSWVKYEVVHTLRAGETTKEAETRVVDHVNAASMRTVHEVVDKVREETQ